MRTVVRINYYKSSDCPICEKERKPTGTFLSKISAPARRALEREKILSLKILQHSAKMKFLACTALARAVFQS